MALLEIEEALCRLAELDERQAKVVELRYFGGMTVEEAALVLDVSEATVARDWRAARAWLHRELTRTVGQVEPRRRSIQLHYCRASREIGQLLPRLDCSGVVGAELILENRQGGEQKVFRFASTFSGRSE